ncbi:baseplate J/gp47 family protein [Leptospira borgpetersenii]|uniref:Baseplate J-like protein n=2 Tax=Leptospira borgpetersenii TaxID=174 RepID=M3FC87_LEPBO|nr:baseplate J/gp47 family protein [Leptospira borgpetersenii]EKP13323.1 baseplate J-like protein [Leptospira borgpetersenii str. 200801926]EMF99482.1 baseplate J-like protein [Leptospira borgpetersenii str. 200701203]ENO65429.1 baseplate J-like protein [Leptospira borgpetersenii serovar Mini str. 201000851]
MILYTTKSNVQRELERDVKGSKVFESHDFSQLSKVGTILRSLANAVFLFVDQNILSLQKAIHYHTAEEEDLHEWLKRYGLEWKGATNAKHKIRIGSKTAVPYSVPIPTGKIIGTSDRKILFQIIQEAKILPTTLQDSRGFYTVEVMCEALESGTKGNVAENAISDIVDFIEDCDVVYNPSTIPDFVARDRETIASVRSRLKEAEIKSSSMWTPEWYVSEALGFSFVERAIFKSSKAIGNPGVVKLLLKGAGGELSPSQLQIVEDYFESEDKDPGGVAKVVCENIDSVEIDKVFIVYFASAESIPDQITLENVVESYFFGLRDGDDFVTNTLRSNLLNLPDAVQCDVDNADNVFVNPGSLAVKGSGFDVTATVYSG